MCVCVCVLEVIKKMLKIGFVVRLCNKYGSLCLDCVHFVFCLFVVVVVVGICIVRFGLTLCLHALQILFYIKLRNRFHRLRGLP